MVGHRMILALMYALIEQIKLIVFHSYILVLMVAGL